MRRGKMAWEYIVAIIIALLVVLLILIFALDLKEYLIQTATEFVEGIIGI